MAGDKADKEKGAKKKGGGLGALLPKVFGIISVLCATVLFAAALDIGHLGLADMMGIIAAVPLGLFALLGLAGLFMGPKPTAAVAAGDDGSVAEALADLKSKTASRFAAMENTIDGFSGQDKETLLAENKELREQLDAIHQAERSKVDDEIEQLRVKNEELEEQIKKWARSAVNSAVGGDEVEPQQAA